MFLYKPVHLNMLSMCGNTNWLWIANFRPLFLIGVLFLFVHHVDSISSQLPCHFLDSVNITEGKFMSNKSIIFDGIEFDERDYKEFDYIWNGDQKIPTSKHLRGCLCNRKPCVRLCCRSQLENDTELCSPNENVYNVEHPILNEYNESISAKLDQHFRIVESKPCQKLYIAESDFQITHKGQILHEDQTLEHHQYCLRAVNSTKNTIDWKLLVCYETETNGSYVVLPTCMLISVLFIIATLFIYGCIPKLRKLNGKCLMCYLATLAVGYLLLSAVQMNGHNYIEPALCTTIAHSIYVSMISAFLWLNVINFDLWMSFQSSSTFRKMTDQKKFLLYSLYGFGLPCILTLTTSVIDRIESVPSYLRRRLGTQTCFLHEDWLSRFIFYYAPISVTISLNMVFHILTFKKGSRNHRIAKLMIFYLALEHTWITEVISFLVSANSSVFLISDMWNCLRGIFIFLLIITSHKVLGLIEERWKDLRGKSSSKEAITLNNYSQTREII